MARFLTTRRKEWIPVVALLALAVGLASALGSGPLAWAFAGGLVLGALGVSWGLRQRHHAEAPAPPKPERAEPTPLRRLESQYDLEKDRTTDSQRWLM